MKGKVHLLRILKAIHVLSLGIQIELKRKQLELVVRMSKDLSSDSVIRENNALSKLGIKWMNLGMETTSLPLKSAGKDS